MARKIVTAQDEEREFAAAMESAGTEFASEGGLPEAVAQAAPEHAPEFEAEMRKLARAQARQLRRDAARAAGKLKGRGPVPVLPRLPSYDDTVYVDQSGKDLREPGFRYTWAPDGQALLGHSSRIRRNQAEGYEVVHDSETGEEVRSQYGVLMRISNRNAAIRVMAKSPTHGVSPEDYYGAAVEEMVETTTRGTVRAKAEGESRAASREGTWLAAGAAAGAAAADED